MLAVYCPDHAAEVLITPSGIDAVRNTPAGIEIEVRCVCGWRGRVLTGRRAVSDQLSAA